MLDSVLGLGLVLFMAGVILLHAWTGFRRGKKNEAQRAGPVFRAIPAIQRMQQAIGLTVEAGKRLHVSLGRSSVIDPNAASALAGLATLEQIAQMSIVSDRPPVATSGEGSLAILSQDTLRAAYRMNNALEQYDPDRGFMTGPTSFPYIAGSIPLVQHEDISTNILLGNFGPEIALLTEASDRQKAFSVAGSDNLAAQAVLYAAAQEPLIGEELFAVPAYLHAGKSHAGSLQAQDVVRWLLISGVVVAVILKLAGVSL